MKKHPVWAKHLRRPWIPSCLILLSLLPALLCSGCAKPADSILELDWFCDVSFWKGVTPSLDPDTITGQITEKTGISCNLTIPTQNAGHELNLLILKDKLPDVISLTDKTARKQLVDSGKVWNLQEFLERYDPDSHLLQDFPEDIKQLQIQAEGGWYSFPSHISTEDARKQYPPCDMYFVESMYHHNNVGIMFSRAWMDKFHLTDKDVQTEAAFLSTLQKISSWKEETGSPLIPVLLDGNRYVDSALNALAHSFGALPLNPNGHYQDLFFSDAYRHALAFCNTLYREGYLDSKQFKYENSDVREQIASGNVFCFIGAIPNTGYHPKEWYSVGPILSSESTAPAVSVRAKLSGGWICTYISKDCKDPEKTAAWLSYLTSDEGMTLSYYGIPNVDCTTDSNGHMMLTETGQEHLKDYEKTGLQALWPFCNVSWIDSKAAPPAKDSSDYHGMMITTALARHESSHIYEGALIDGLEEEESITEAFGDLVNNVKQYKKQQITLLIMADRQDSFERIYTDSTAHLQEIGIQELSQKLDEIYQNRCQTYALSLLDDLKEQEEYLSYFGHL